MAKAIDIIEKNIDSLKNWVITCHFDAPETFRIPTSFALVKARDKDRFV